LALFCACALSQFFCDRRAAEDASGALISLGSEQGFGFWSAAGSIFRGWAMVDRGPADKAINRLRQGLAAYRATGAEHLVTYFLALLAEAHRDRGQAAEGLVPLSEALELMRRTGERCYEAELHRLRGELFLTVPDRTRAERCFRRAIEVARGQDTKMWELRAATSLARLWLEQGRRAQAHDLLGPVYGWFTEGLDTPNLREAKALLEELC
jgi:predicted ATPase